MGAHQYIRQASPESLFSLCEAWMAVNEALEEQAGVEVVCSPMPAPVVSTCDVGSDIPGGGAA